LSQCEECREQLAELNSTAASLAYGTVAPAPPARLRASVLEAAAAERTNVVPLRQRRWMRRGLAVAAAAAACIIVGFAVSLSQSNHTHFSSMSVSRDASGHVTIHVVGLNAAPHGKTYEAWVIPPGHPARPAALFPGGATTTSRFPGTVPPRSVVAVTLDAAGGVNHPTTKPIFVAPT